MDGDLQRWLSATRDALRANDLHMAVQHLARALDAAPGDAGLWVQQGQLQLRLGRRRDSLDSALRAESLGSTDAAIEDALGTLLTHLEEPLRALPHFEGAVRRTPTSHAMRYNLAMAQRMVGEFAAAEYNLDRVIAARPDDGEAYHARSDLRRQSPDRNHVAELEQVLSRLKGRRAALPVAFALAKELEDLGEYGRSFACLQSAAKAHRATLRYEVADDLAVLKKLCATHTAEALERVASDFGSEECIFIIGLPRSGTTLLESILGTHPDVFAAGEMDAFSRVLIEEVGRGGHTPVTKLDFVNRALQADFTTLGPRYLEATRPRTGQTPKFTDKLPLNYLYAGLIHAALPRARFVGLRRQPMDNCYAMYRTLFAAAYPFSYDLNELGRYYGAWNELMRHWQNVIGDAWLNVQYEELVADPDRIIPGIVAHCGLSWDAACLRFHERRTGITTASAVQVRRPLNTDSVGRWQKFARELEPLAQLLESQGIAVR